MKKSLFFLLMIVMATLTNAQMIVFHENFDPPSNADSVIANGAPNNFSINTRLHYTGSQCDSTFVPINDSAYLTTNSFSTIGYASVFLTFSHICKIEYYDAGEIMVSVNYGPWVKLTTEYINPGNSQFTASGYKFNSLTYPNDWAPTHDSIKPSQLWWKNETFDIGAIAGNKANVRIRFDLRDGNSNGAHFNRGWYIDNIKISDSILVNNIIDAAPISITYPVPTYSGSITPFQVVMKNNGSVTLTQIPFIIKYNNIISLDTLFGSLPPGATANHTFHLNIVLCEKELTLISNLPVDFNRSNDTIKKLVLGSKIISLPPSFSDNFETNNNCFYSNTGWFRGIPTSPVIDTAHSYLNCWKTNLSGNYAPNSTYYLYSPYFDFSNVQNNVYLKFWHFYNTESNKDGCRIRYSLNGGTTWIVLGLVNDPSATNWYNTNTSGVPAWSGNSYGWIRSTYNLSSIPTIVNATTPVQFRFELITDNLNSQFDGWAIDDFMIESPCHAYFWIQPDTAVSNHFYTINASNGVAPISYIWNWGDGKTSTGPNPSHTYDSVGWYKICLTLNDNVGCTSTYCDSLFVNNIPPPIDTCISAFTYRDTATHIVRFFDQSTTTKGHVNSWSWTVSQNGTQLFTSSLRYPVFTLQPWVLYDVCLFITTDSGCSAQSCKNIMVQDSSACVLTVTSVVNHVSVINGSDGNIDLTVSGGQPPYSYAWSNNDTTQDINNLSCGTYTVMISTIPACPKYNYTFQILQPYNNIIVDTLYSPIIDTCLNFVIDSFYVASITVQGNNVIVEWIFTGGSLSATLYATYTFTSTGAQFVVLTVSCGAKDLVTFSTYIYISTAYGLLENAETNLISLYPNPVSDFLNIMLNTHFKDPLLLRIYSSTGQLVYNRSIAAYTRQVGINVSELPKGIYFVRLEDGIRKPIVKKFIK